MIAALLALCLVCQQPPAADAHANDAPANPKPPAATAPASPARAIFLRGLTRMEATEFDSFVTELSRFAAEELAGRRRSIGAEREHRRQVLIGLSTLFDSTGLLETHPLTRPFFGNVVETAEERLRRSRIGGWVRFHGRNDAVRHFFVSAALCTLAGPVIAERAGRSKEIRDAHDLELTGQGQGFSFTDLAYNHAGIRYASWLLGWPGKHHLEEPPMALDAFLPRFDELDLPEQLDWPSFQKTYYGKNWGEYRRQVERIHAHIEGSLAAHGAPARAPGTAPTEPAAQASGAAEENTTGEPETDTGQPGGGL